MIQDFLKTSELTMHNASQVLAAGQRAIEAGEREFDFASFVKVDSSAVAVMLAWKRVANAKGQDLVFKNMPDNLCSLVGLYGLSTVL